MTVATGRERSVAGGAGMEDEKGEAAGIGFLGVDRVRLLLPEKLPAAWRKVRRRGSWLIPFCLLYLLAFTCSIFDFMSSPAALKRRELLASMCDERSRLVQHHFNASMNHLQALAILVSTFHHSKNPSAMDQTTFARYAERTAFEGPLTRGGGVAYAVRVTHDERELFERQQDWSIKKMYSSEVREQEEEYAPVIFAQGAYKHVISFDMLSGKEDRANVLRARESGKGVLTAPFKLLDNRLGVILTYAVYKSELPSNASPQERTQAAIGYLGGIFDIETLVDKLLHQLAGDPSITVNLYDTTSEIPISMYGSNDADSGSGLWHVSPLNLGDPSRKHEMRCRFTDGPSWPWLSIRITSLAVITLVIASMIQYIIHAKYAERVREAYALMKGSEDAATVESLFFASTTHGIRTSINGVLGMLRMLMDTDLDTTQQDYVRTAQASAKVLVSLNNDVLDQAKFYHGKFEHKTVPFDGRPVCDDTLSLFCGEALEKGKDGYVSKPFEGELSYLANHLCQEELQQHKIVEKQEPNLHTRSKFITKFKKLTRACIHSFPSKVYVNKRVVSVGLLGLVLCILAIGIFELPFNQSLGIRSGDSNMTSNNFGHSHGRLLVASPHSTWANRGVQSNGMISVDLGNMRGNNSVSFGEQRHISSHNSSEIIPGVLFVSRNGTQVQNRTGKPHLPLPAHKSHKITVGPWIALVSVIMLALGIAVWLLLRCNSRKRAPQNELELLGARGPRRFQLHELAAATSNFTEENKLGQGGFGPVYKGYLSDQDRHVAVKVLSKKQSSQEQSEQELREFMAEVRVMTQLRHRNIVKLVGWCDSNKRLLLVYELMAQGSLDKHLYDPRENFNLAAEIALDLGSALLYLHRDCEKCIVHGDIKPANVMLDVSHNAKLGDFGLARLIEHGDEPQTTQIVAGTAGYIDPEFINNRWPRTELDVYSFGVVLLEIACGKRPASRQPNGASSLLAWVLGLHDRGMILDASDQRLNGEFDQRQMERVLITGLWCAHQNPMQRPSIVQAMDVLRSADAELPVLPAVVRDARRILSMEEQAYGELPVTDRPVHGAAGSTYFTSKDSAYLLAEE